jgi:hypothetical protein
MINGTASDRTERNRQIGISRTGGPKTRLRHLEPRPDAATKSQALMRSGAPVGQIVGDQSVTEE